MKGYYLSKHIFGKSNISRTGSRTFIAWQKRQRQKLTASTVISLTHKQYNKIKKLLGPIVSQQINTIDNKRSIVYTHETNSKYYMRIKRYLKREGLI